MRKPLTIARHADGQAFFKAAVLASVAVEPDNQTFTIAQAPVLDLFLDTPPEETLQSFTHTQRNNKNNLYYYKEAEIKLTHPFTIYSVEERKQKSYKKKQMI